MKRSPIARKRPGNAAGRTAWARTAALVLVLDPMCRCWCRCGRPSRDPAHLEKLGMGGSRYRASDPRNDYRRVVGACRPCHERCDNMPADRRGECRLPTVEELRELRRGTLVPTEGR